MNKLPDFLTEEAKNKTDKELLDLSIEKWRAIIEFLEEGEEVTNIGRNSCPLCKKYNILFSQRCSDCPIGRDTSQSGCKGTPYQNYEFDARDTLDSDDLEGARAELDYLQELYDRLYPEPKPEPVSFPRITEDLGCEKTLENENYKVYVHDTFVVVEGKKPDKPKEVFIYTSGAVDIKDETNYKRVCERGKLLISEPKPQTKYQQMPFISFHGDEILLVNGKEEAGSKGHDHLYVIKNGEVIASVHISTSSELPRFDVYRPGYKDKPIEELLATKDDC